MVPETASLLTVFLTCHVFFLLSLVLLQMINCVIDRQETGILLMFYSMDQESWRRHCKTRLEDNKDDNEEEHRQKERHSLAESSLLVSSKMSFPTFTVNDVFPNSFLPTASDK